MTLPRLVADYLLYRRALGRRLITEGLILRSFCRSFGKRPLTHIRVDSVLAFLRRGSVSHETVARRHRALAGFYRYVQGRYDALLTPLPDLPTVPPSSFVPYIYSHEELKRLLRATTTACKNPLALVDAQTLRTSVLLLYGAGLRLGEALALNVADVDLSQAVLIVRQAKFYKTRLVPLGHDLVEVLITYRHWRDRHFPSDPLTPFFCLRNGKRAHHKVMERTFRLLCVIAHVSRDGGPRRQPRLHDLRHAAAVHRLIEWYRTGADMQQLLPRLATYLGHRNLSSTQRYLTLTPQLLRAASLRFQQYALENFHD
jgi:site-specific recombinase XerD